MIQMATVGKTQMSIMEALKTEGEAHGQTNLSRSGMLPVSRFSECLKEVLRTESTVNGVYLRFFGEEMEPK